MQTLEQNEANEAAGLMRYRGRTQELIGKKVRGSNPESGVPEEGALIDDHSPPATVHIRFVDDCGGIGNRGLADVELFEA